jgi:CDP-glucose 4,6-dehydratase
MRLGKNGDTHMTIFSNDFWKKKSVLITGHTGFKGSWLSIWLSSLGAKVSGYSLPPNTNPNLFNIFKLDEILSNNYIADIRKIESLKKAILDSQPEIIIHMAAQPLVRYSYLNPVDTYSTNIMGIVNLLECVRSVESVRALVVVTSDKCYENKDWLWGYRENDSLGGHDPYSNSKACAELVTSAYRDSFFPFDKYCDHKVAIASARSGNVIGGGDWSDDRLIPDAIKAFSIGKKLHIRNPLAIRPWQHVLESLSGYLLLAQSLYLYGPKFNGSWNFGPNNSDVMSVNEVVNLLISKWGDSVGWTQDVSENSYESHSLKLDISKSLNELNWSPKWDINTAISKIIEWNEAFLNKENMHNFSLKQIDSYIL